jgi:hypothetical protein
MLPEEYAPGVASSLSFWAARRKEAGAFDKLPVEQQETIAMLELRDAARRGDKAELANLPVEQQETIAMLEQRDAARRGDKAALA